MNTHALLKQYHGLSGYTELAQAAAALVKANPAISEADLLAWAETRMAGQSKLTMKDSHAPLAVFGAELIDSAAFTQMRNVLSIPVAVRGALMPDGHSGYAMPIGGVAVLDNAVSPSFVGYDISCMMYLTTYPMNPRDARGDFAWMAEALRESTSFGKGATNKTGRDHPVMYDARWQATNILRGLKPLAQSQLGSSGGGNHFADLMEIHWNDGRPAQIALLTHSGSRGAGHKFATHYVGVARRETSAIAKGVPQGYEWLDTRSEAGQEYLTGMELLGAYALANHRMIHFEFAARLGIEPDWQLWNRHNYAWNTSEGWVHRKGATPAEAGILGIIPGSSGSNSYVVAGLGNVESVYSSSHGAGRPFSRTEAKRRHDEAFVNEWMNQNGITTFGLSPDETVMAYKDIDRVMEAQEGRLVKTVATLVPRVVIMGGESDDGD